jgi:hypothetical protein
MTYQIEQGFDSVTSQCILGAGYRSLSALRRRLRAMSWRDADSPPPGPDIWRTLGWSCAALACAGLLAGLALTGTKPAPYRQFTSDDFFRPEWWVVASLAAYPLFFASRSSWRVALPLTAIVVAQMGYVVNRAVSDMAMAGIATDADRLWYAAWAVQSFVMVAAAAAGARVSLRNRRWERRMRRLAPPARPVPVKPVDDLPRWHEGFYKAG